MERDAILRALSEHTSELQDLGVERLAIFGSVAREQDGPGSDVDVLVDFRGRSSFEAYMDLKFFLEDLLDRPVDLVTRRSLKPRLAPAVEREALYIT